MSSPRRMFLCLAVLIGGCFPKWFSIGSSYDVRTVSVFTLNLFNQRENSKLKEESWNGDWIFRRERLALVDAEIKGSKPDILIFQEMMARNGSPSESDKAILQAGAATGYEFDEVVLKSYSDTYENEMHGFATSTPLQFDDKRMGPSNERGWQFGEDGAISASVIVAEKQAVAVFDVDFPTKNAHDFYSDMRKKMLAFVNDKKLCPKRVIVTGFIPLDPDPDRFEQFTSGFNLRDVSEEACRFSTTCETASTSNEIYNAVNKDQNTGRVDRIFVSQETFVLSAKRVFTTSVPVSSYSKRFGLTRLFPSERFGWSAIIRLPRCPE